MDLTLVETGGIHYLEGDAVRPSHKFREMLVEEQRGVDFHVFDSRSAAEDWLVHLAEP